MKKDAAAPVCRLCAPSSDPATLCGGFVSTFGHLPQRASVTPLTPGLLPSGRPISLPSFFVFRWTRGSLLPCLLCAGWSVAHRARGQQHAPAVNGRGHGKTCSRCDTYPCFLFVPRAVGLSRIAARRVPPAVRTTFVSERVRSVRSRAPVARRARSSSVHGTVCLASTVCLLHSIQPYVWYECVNAHPC